MFLEQIVKFKREEVESAKQKVPLAQLEKNFNRFKKKNFAETIKKSGRASLIAEIKQRSPSAGVLRENFSPVQIAEIYQLGVPFFPTIQPILFSWIHRNKGSLLCG